MSVRKVLHLVYGLDFGGVETHMRLIAAASGRYAHEFRAIGPGGVAEHAIVRSGGKAEALNFDCWKRPLSTVVRLAAVIRQMRPDVVHTHGAEANLFGLPAALLAGVPVRIGEEIGIPTHSFRAHIGYRTAYCLADRVIGISNAVRDFLISSREVPAKKAIRIYNPSYFPSARASSRQRGRALRIGFIGRLSPEKNALGLTRAVLSLIDKGLDVELIVVGAGPESSKIDGLASIAGDKIEVAGFLENPFDLVASCHLYVQPSLSEGFGLALVEAMAMGLPALATSVGGAPEVIEHGRTGWILENVSDDAIAAEIVRIMALDPHLLSEMGERASRSVRARFGVEQYMENIERLYDDVRSGKRLAMGETAG